MKLLIPLFFLFISKTTLSQLSKKELIFSFGLGYRQYPIDIEDVSRGPLPKDGGLPSNDNKFWQSWSIHGSAGRAMKKNWIVSASIYSRYNLLHRTKGININTTPFTQNVSVKKNFKYDFFLDIEKKFSIKKNKERYLFTIIGLGFTNINSKFDITLTDTTDTGPFPSRHYQGTLLHFGPRINLGYQYNKIKFSIDAYIIENPTLTNLTSLWIGGSLGYELPLKRKKSNR